MLVEALLAGKTAGTAVSAREARTCVVFRRRRKSAPEAATRETDISYHVASNSGALVPTARRSDTGGFAGAFVFQDRARREDT